MSHYRILTVCLLALLLSGPACEKKTRSDAETAASSPSGKTSSEPLQLIILGPPGAGKGTQAKNIVAEYAITHVSTGDMLRAEVAGGSKIGKLAKEYMDRGDLVPDDIVLKMVEARLSAPDCRGGFILDGFPRTLVQADGLEQILARRDVKTIKVINLAVPDEVLVARMLARKRADDTEETIQNRIRVYYEKTTPLIDYYKQKGILININGDQTIEDVFESIHEELNSK